jgi:glycosyltransferase involved in cell wall biosynthesis
LGGRSKLDARVFVRLLSFLRQERPHILHAFLFWANVAARIAGRCQAGIRVLSSYHDEMVQEGWLVRMVDRWTLQWTEAMVCCSQAVRHSVCCRIGGDQGRYVVIPFGVETSERRSDDLRMLMDIGLRDGVPVVGTVCRLVEPKKGLRVLLESVRLINKRSPGKEWQVLIVGDGPARGELENLSRRLGLDRQVLFAGLRRDIPELLPQFDVFVLPSLYEGFGIAILEAMAAARPVVTTRVGGIPEFLENGNTGVLVPPGDARALADAIGGLLDHPDRAKEMGLRGREHVRKSFGMDSIVGQHERLYETCLSQQGGLSSLNDGRAVQASSVHG